MIYLHKLLPLIVSPLGLVLFLLVIGIASRRRWPNVAAVIVLLISSLPLTAFHIWKSLEADYPYESSETLESYDAVVVLSGILGGFESASEFVIQWGDPDRFFTGIDLVKSGKADRLIFTRGQIPWENTPPEGELLKLKAQEMGIPASQILLTGIATNTSDEAREVRKLIDREEIESLLLVTSSFHMPRAKRLFDSAGVNTKPYPTDFKAANENLTWLSFLPSADGLKKTSSGIREYIGRLYYRLRFGQ